MNAEREESMALYVGGSMYGIDDYWRWCQRVVVPQSGGELSRLKRFEVDDFAGSRGGFQKLTKFNIDQAAGASYA